MLTWVPPRLYGDRVDTEVGSTESPGWNAQLQLSVKRPRGLLLGYTGTELAQRRVPLWYQAGMPNFRCQYNAPVGLTSAIRGQV